jgi:4'-phosphopantetheinyl transferase
MTSAASLWSAPPAHLSLRHDEVHVWRADLSQMLASVASCCQLLTPDEYQRAEKFRFAKDRERFILARGLLRTILSHYLHLRPEQLRFSYNAWGKPSLAQHCGGALRFNVSHAHELALYGITSGREIGLDLEHMREDMDCEQIAERFFSRREVEMLRALPASQRTVAFFNCWVRKEAYIKAKGQGLSLPLDDFDVSLSPGEPAALLSMRDDTQELLRWSLRELKPGLGYVAAVAAEGSDWRLRCWQWR